MFYTNKHTFCRSIAAATVVTLLLHNHLNNMQECIIAKGVIIALSARNSKGLIGRRIVLNEQQSGSRIRISGVRFHIFDEVFDRQWQ